MTEYVSNAVFVYTDEASDYCAALRDNPHGVDVSALALDALQSGAAALPDGTVHIVLAGRFPAIKTLFELALQRDCSVGILPLPAQSELRRIYDLPNDRDEAIELALRRDAPRVDLKCCNGAIVLDKATVGRLPLIDSPHDISRWGMVVQAARRLIGIRLLPFEFTTSGGQTIKTAACGCAIVPHRMTSRAFRNLPRSSSVGDDIVTLVVSAPSSILGYLEFLWQTLGLFAAQTRRLPSTLSLVKSSEVTVSSDQDMAVHIDGEPAGELPLRCEVRPDAIALNIGAGLHEAIKQLEPPKERLNIRNLPKGADELAKASRKTIPFFPYASEERFCDLFTALRDDAKTNSTYVLLMLFSTLLATIGLYQDSTAVVIGAMLLAPLMAPIISLAMGLRREDRKLSKPSIIKILVGIAIALGAAAAVTLLFPHEPITGEMEARLQPSLLDLAVAIVAGVAGAYTKSYKEILQSLAGVAIAVALVPPLAVAGTGLGRGDFFFFGQAFLLFATNLVGIILAASFTFRVLGYSPAVRGKRSIRLVALVLVLITVPLYLSYQQIVETKVREANWRHERFLVNGKYLIVQNARLERHHDKDIMRMDLLAREVITRDDLTEFRKKMQADFDRKLLARVNIVYIP